MRWLEDLLFDGWWSTQVAVQMVQGQQVARSMTYGELMRRAAGMAYKLQNAIEQGRLRRVAIFAASGPEHLIADLAGLLAGVAVVSVPISERHIWPDDLLDDISIVIADSAGRRALNRYERSCDRQGLYDVLPVDIDAPGTALAPTPPTLRGEQDDVCKVIFVDSRPPHRMVALTVYALDSIVCSLRRAVAPRLYRAHGHIDRLTEQVWVYRTLAVQGTVVYATAPEAAGLPVLVEQSRISQSDNDGPAHSLVEIFSSIVEGQKAIDALARDMAVPAGVGAV